MNASRSEILSKIRLSLARPRREHHHGHNAVTNDIRKLFASASSHENLVQTFKQEFERVSGEFHHCSNGDAVVHSIKDLITSAGSKHIAVSRHALCERLNVRERLAAVLPDAIFVDESIDGENPFERERLQKEMAQVQFSITGVDYLMAETGTALLVSGKQASRQISLLPSIHLFLASPNQIYPNMAEVFLELQERHGNHLPGNALTLITGPSRTADIEKVLIKGVHGPTRLIGLVVELQD